MPNINVNYELLKPLGLDNELNERVSSGIEKKFNEIWNYTPKIGVVGKTGVGKSSLCNALFGDKICLVNDIESTTRVVQAVPIELQTHTVILYDFPGLGESDEVDKMYAATYKQMALHLDLVIFVIQANDRALLPEKQLYENIIQPYYMQNSVPVLFAISKVCNIPPDEEWDVQCHHPSVKQQENIDKKIKQILDYFSVSRENIIPISATEGYQLSALLERIVDILPVERRLSIIPLVNNNLVSPVIMGKTERSLRDVIENIIITLIGSTERVLVALIQETGNAIATALKNFFFTGS